MIHIISNKFCCTVEGMSVLERIRRQNRTRKAEPVGSQVRAGRRCDFEKRLRVSREQWLVDVFSFPQSSEPGAGGRSLYPVPLGDFASVEMTFLLYSARALQDDSASAI